VHEGRDVGGLHSQDSTTSVYQRLRNRLSLPNPHQGDLRYARFP
jgi:hypothetical protein